jgi:glucose/arabinose dehydrogenase/N-acetylneuraminic acid mutarotase
MSNHLRFSVRVPGVIVLVVLALLLEILGNARAAVAQTHTLQVSSTVNRANAAALANKTVSGTIYVFVSPQSGITRVRFFLDNPQMTGTPRQVETFAPYDFAGTAANGAANPFNTAQIADGSHTITAAVDLSTGGTEILNATFTVANSPALTLSASTVSFTVAQGGSTPAKTVNLTTSNGTAANYSISENAPWLTVSPISGTTPATLTLTVNAAGLSPGTYTANLSATASGYRNGSLNVTLTVTGGAYSLLVSTAANRSSPAPLQGRSLTGNQYIFVSPATGITRVRFFLDNPNMTGTPRQVETLAAYDFAGTAASGSANPFNTAQLSNGSHTITAAVDRSAGGTEIVNATFIVANTGPALVFSPDTVLLGVNAGGTASSQVNLGTSNGTVANYAISENSTWLTVTPATGSTPSSLTFTVNATGLTPNTYAATVTATANGYVTDTVAVTLTVGQSGACSPLPCSEILVDLPYELDFGQNHGKILDGSGIGTGFTYIDAPTNGTGYIPGNLTMDPTAGTLKVKTTAGLASASANSLDNALAVGIDAPSQISVIATTLVKPPAGTGNFEQGGLWFGNDEDNHVKLVVLSTSTGTKIEYLMEQGGVHSGAKSTGNLNLSNATVALKLRANPFDQKITAFYRIDGGTEQTLGEFVAPGEFFSFDAAGIDPEIGTRSFGGIFASHRNGPTFLVYSFDAFSVTAEALPQPTPSVFSFNRVSSTVPSPTSLAWGPDNRLYVSELLGKIHALTFNGNKQVIADEVITTLGSRLTLGITVDPLSTPNNVILWVSHSSPSLNNGTPNSGIISRLSGIGFSVRQDVITGLPRAIANHATNSIHFGPDGKLYIAQGGNTGAGAPNTANTEFGAMEEQPLSAAILVADVRSPNFDGSCHNSTDIFGPPPCSVIPYATGLRNTYDFVFHSNGRMYAPDNGLGVVGTYPPSPVPPCFGLGDVNSDNPGAQPDELNIIVQGGYYGHPNPYRNECVFKDGSDQNVAPPDNWVPPIFNLGNNRSSNGTIEYTAGAFCNALRGSLLIANYSIGDNIVSVKLSTDGLSVLQSSNLVSGFNDPLPLALGPDGTIYVGELGGNKITALTPIEIGCWTAKQPLPASILDAGGTALNGKLYLVAGKTSIAHVSTMYIYDPIANSWTTGPNLPGPAVENPAVVALNGRLYVFGGSTAPFSGAINNAAVFDPTTNGWTSLAPMMTARGGATAQAINGLIYVAGGMGTDGASLSSFEVYNPTTNSWAAALPMGTRRDNPGSAVLGGNLYIFGGRTRNTDGTTVNGTLNTVEMYNPVTKSWTARAPMPTGRRTMVVGLLGGRAQLMGGEITASGGTFEQNEEYDPVTNSWRSLLPMLTPRHGAAAASINGTVYVTGGGPSGGSSFTNVTEAFTLGN